MQVDTICKIHVGDINTFKFKEVFVSKFSVPTIEILCETCIPTFHQFLNPHILHDIDKGVGDAVGQVFVRSKECVTNFMSYEHVIDIVTGLVPDRQDQDASLNVELCGRTILMFNNQILSRQKFGELGLDFMTYR